MIASGNYAYREKVNHETKITNSDVVTFSGISLFGKKYFRITSPYSESTYLHTPDKNTLILEYGDNKEIVMPNITIDQCRIAIEEAKVQEDGARDAMIVWIQDANAKRPAVTTDATLHELND